MTRKNGTVTWEWEGEAGEERQREKNISFHRYIAEDFYLHAQPPISGMKGVIVKKTAVLKSSYSTKTSAVAWTANFRVGKS